MKFDKIHMSKILNELYKSIVYIMSLIVITTVILFEVGVSINVSNILIPILIFFSYFFYRKDISFEEKIIIILSVFLIFWCSIIISMNIYDFSVDGNAYHKQAVGLLKEGWNPIYQKSEDYNEITQSSQLSADSPLFWSEVYPKATWYYAATIYYVTNSIEAGKSYTIIFAIALVCYAYTFFRNRVRRKHAVILSVLTGLNPIILAQFQSYYLDGAVASILTMLIFNFVDEVTNEKILNKRVIFCLILWAVNLKFSVLFFVVTYCFVFVIYRVIKVKKINIDDICYLGFSGVISILIFGYAPYITNYKRYNNMFYGFIGMISNTDKSNAVGIDSLSTAKRFFVSLFGKMCHGNGKEIKEVIKFPFTYEKSEFDFYYVVDPRNSAFGILFSGLFLISIIIIIITIAVLIKNKLLTDEFEFIIALLLVGIIEIIYTPKAYEFRYVPQLYLTVILAIAFLFKYFSNRKSQFMRTMFLMLVLINICPWGIISVGRIGGGVRTTTILNKMEEESQINGKVYEVSFCNETYNGLDYNLKEKNIKYTYLHDAVVDSSFSYTLHGMIRYR